MIQKVKIEIEKMKESDGLWDGENRNKLKDQLDLAYREEEQYWSQKVRVQWLEEGDKIISFFNASVMQRKKCNRMDYMEKEQ